MAALLDMAWARSGEQVSKPGKSMGEAACRTSQSTDEVIHLDVAQGKVYVCFDGPLFCPYFPIKSLIWIGLGLFQAKGRREEVTILPDTIYLFKLVVGFHNPSMYHWGKGFSALLCTVLLYVSKGEAYWVLWGNSMAALW